MCNTVALVGTPMHVTRVWRFWRSVLVMKRRSPLLAADPCTRYVISTVGKTNRQTKHLAGWDTHIPGLIKRRFVQRVASWRSGATMSAPSQTVPADEFRVSTCPAGQCWDCTLNLLQPLACTLVHIPRIKKQSKLCGLSPRANYTDRKTATCPPS
jgi:hypothetical protein